MNHRLENSHLIVGFCLVRAAFCGCRPDQQLVRQSKWTHLTDSAETFDHLVLKTEDGSTCHVALCKEFEGG